MIWYAKNERIELSGKVVANHITKAANLLALEYDLAPGALAVLDLPAHWKTALWAQAAALTGATLRFLNDEESFLDFVDEQALVPSDDTVVVSSNAAHLTTLYDLNLPAWLLALNPASLAFSWDEHSAVLPPETSDASAEVMSQADALLIEAHAAPAALHPNIRVKCEHNPCTPESNVAAIVGGGASAYAAVSSALRANARITLIDGSLARNSPDRLHSILEAEGASLIDI